MSEAMTGGCLCGAVRYSASIASDEAYLCHCSMCQRAVGNVSVAMLNVLKTDVTWTGEPRFYRSSPIATRGFCPTCGSRVFNEPEGDGIEIRVGSLDMAPTDVEPTYEIWVKRRENWLAPLEEAEQFDEDRP